MEDCLGISCRCTCPDGLADCLALFGSLLRCPDGLVTVVNCLELSCRCAAGLGDWHRCTLSGSLLQLPRWY
ncbi:hypothetical protein DPMN_186747 [Dreissena polymorpha]|uniref:Uncharacterized protein n=1 Tax=Dreissena polymorpha TaxID=45954 RepID=A0A9D4DPN2_DREPO|nr:hypothetical protein DPMN_186747 [Dreissena polymorpha]